MVTEDLQNEMLHIPDGQLQGKVQQTDIGAYSRQIYVTQAQLHIRVPQVLQFGIKHTPSLSQDTPFVERKERLLLLLGLNSNSPLIALIGSHQQGTEECCTQYALDNDVLVTFRRIDHLMPFVAEPIIENIVVQ